MPQNDFTEARFGAEILDSDRLSVNKAYYLIKYYGAPWLQSCLLEEMERPISSR